MARGKAEHLERVVPLYGVPVCQEEIDKGPGPVIDEIELLELEIHTIGGAIRTPGVKLTADYYEWTDRTGRMGVDIDTLISRMIEEMQNISWSSDWGSASNDMGHFRVDAGIDFFIGLYFMCSQWGINLNANPMWNRFTSLLLEALVRFYQLGVENGCQNFFEKRPL